MLGLTPEQEAAYALDHGVDRADLTPEAQAEYDRLLDLADAASPEQPRPVGWAAALASCVPGPPGRLLRSALRHPRLLTTAGSIVAVAIVLAFFVLEPTPPPANSHELQAELAQVHFPPGYRLASQHQAGPDCVHQGCVIIQTWEWARSSNRTTSAACADALNALSSAYSGTESNSPIPAHSPCDYFAVVPSSPTKDKTSLVVVVYNGQAHANSGLIVVLSAGNAAGPWPPITGG